MLFFFAMMGSGRAVVSTIGQVRQVSFEAYDQNTRRGLFHLRWVDGVERVEESDAQGRSEQALFGL